MKKLFICAFLVYAASLQAQPMGKGNLPPVFPKEVAEKTQFDTRTRAYISPVRVMWTQNGDLITGSENLLLQGNGQATQPILRKPFSYPKRASVRRSCWISVVKSTGDCSS